MAIDKNYSKKKKKKEKKIGGKNGLPILVLIGHHHSLVGKWPMADHHFVLWRNSEVQEQRNKGNSN